MSARKDAARASPASHRGQRRPGGELAVRQADLTGAAAPATTTRRVVLEGAKLVFSLERADEFIPELRAFWAELSSTGLASSKMPDPRAVVSLAVRR